jgi:hypothetical protein
MTAPTSLTNGAAQSLDTIYDSAGAGGLKLGLGAVTAGALTPPAKWQGAATHVDGSAFGIGADGVSVAGVKDGAGNAVALKAGVAGTPAATVLTVQGNASGTPVPVSVVAAAGPTAVMDSATGAASALAATLPATPGKTTYITGFQVTGLGATVGVGITVTVTGLATTQSFIMGVVAGVLLGTPALIVSFPTPVPASAANTAIVVHVPSFGTGNTLAAVAAQGFQI